MTFDKRIDQLREDRSGVFLLLERPEGLSGRRGRPWDRLAARLRSFSLDARLAAGQLPESGRLLALRARALVAPEARHRLARDWRRVAEMARAKHRPRAGRVALHADLAGSAGIAITRLCAALSAPLPVPVQGVAMASHLLVDAAGPLFSPRGRPCLSRALEDAISHLDPWRSLELPVSPLEHGRR